jgi:hypothetical protein
LQIRETYSHRKQFRLRLLVPLKTLYEAYKELGNLDLCVHIAAEMLDCLEEPQVFEYGPDICRKAIEVLHKMSERHVIEEHLRDHYVAERDKYAHRLRELVKVRSGVDIDFVSGIADGRITAFP